MQDQLLKKYIDGNITREELKQFAALAEQEGGLDAVLRAHWDAIAAAGEITGRDWENKTDAMLEEVAREERIYGGQAPVHPREEARDKRIHFLKRYKWIAAAVILFAIATTYFILDQKTKAPSATIITAADIKPGKEGALLKLSDGRIIATDSLADGLIAMDGKTKVFKKDGRISYEGDTESTEIVYNEIIADKGKKIGAVLPDGSFVSLNAASSIRYPLQFKGKERLMEMTGEAFFEVVHNAAMPFRVKVKDQLVEDIGTAFNINAYDDESSIHTTLVEGAALVKKGDKQATVKAGQQAITSANAGGIKVSDADTEQATAWLRNQFSFAHADIPTIMRQFARWYNLEVVYPEGVPADTFTGGIQRSFNLQQALDVLKDIRIHYRIEEGKRIVILP